MDSPIFDRLRNAYGLMCGTCRDHGWPYGMFVCEGPNNLCD